MELEKITKSVCEIANQVAVFIINERVVFSEKDVKYKGMNGHDLVSYVDISAEKMLIENLSALVPAADFISEESNTKYQNGLNWIVDPLDGTTNFVHGIPFYCISIALALNSEILLGVVLEVNRKECFYSWKGGKSYCNGQEIRVSNTLNLPNALIATGFSVKESARLDDNLCLLKFWIENTRGLRRLGSAALDLCYVAKGIFDVFYETNLSAWDIAAGMLIVANAGGEISDFNGTTDVLFGNEILASNTALHKNVIEVISKLIQQK